MDGFEKFKYKRATVRTAVRKSLTKCVPLLSDAIANSDCDLKF